jgi:hypothetical protein
LEEDGEGEAAEDEDEEAWSNPTKHKNNFFLRKVKYLE